MTTPFVIGYSSLIRHSPFVIRHSPNPPSPRPPRPLSCPHPMPHSSFNLLRLRANLKPFRLYWFPSLRSTNDHAAALRKSGRLFAPAIVLTAHQTAGRGRGANAWWSAAGCLTVTFAFPIEEQLRPHQVPLVAGLAVRDAVAQLTGDHDVGLKWPNDIVHHGRKLAGLLCERIHRLDLIGLGINVNLDERHAPPPLRNRITSLSSIAAHNFDISDTLITIAAYLRRTLSRQLQQTFPALLQEYDRHHVLVGRQVRAQTGEHKPPIIGRCTGLDHLGRLVLQAHGHTHRIAAAHIELV